MGNLPKGEGSGPGDGGIPRADVWATLQKCNGKWKFQLDAQKCEKKYTVSYKKVVDRCTLVLYNIILYQNGYLYLF